MNKQRKRRVVFDERLPTPRVGSREMRWIVDPDTSFRVATQTEAD